MKRARSGLVWILLSLTSVSCGGDRGRSLLRPDAALVCRAGQPILVSAQGSGQFRLNFALLDSSALIRMLPVILGPRSEKIVMVRVDSARNADLRWIVRAIERGGGIAYASGAACLQPRSALASARANSMLLVP